MQGSVHITMAIWKELEEMAENLESHMDEPDVKEQIDGRHSQLKCRLPAGMLMKSWRCRTVE